MDDLEGRTRSLPYGVFFFLYLNTSSAEMWKVFCCVMRDVFGL